MKGIILTGVAILLGMIVVPFAILLALILYPLQHRFNDYTNEVAISLDAFLGVVCAPFLNLVMIFPSGYKFGNRKETVSSGLGKNKKKGTLTWFGMFTCWVLGDLEKNHVEKAIDEKV